MHPGPSSQDGTRVEPVTGTSFTPEDARVSFQAHDSPNVLGTPVGGERWLQVRRTPALLPEPGSRRLIFIT